MGSCTYYVITDLGGGAPNDYSITYYVLRGVRKMVTVYHESWGITSGILFP